VKKDPGSAKGGASAHPPIRPICAGNLRDGVEESMQETRDRKVALQGQQAGCDDARNEEAVLGD
jgi:hypothetical protein